MITEQEFQDQVTELAEMLGWSWAHFRPARTQHGWRVPVSGPLGRGWPDLILVRDTRLILAELKRDRKQHPSPEQQFVLQLFSDVAETFVWRPDDLEEIAAILSRRA